MKVPGPSWTIAAGELLDKLVDDRFAILRLPGESDAELRDRALDASTVTRTIEEE